MKNVVNPISKEVVAQPDYNGHYGAYRHIMAATHFLSKVDGVGVVFSIIDKAVLHYLIDQIGYSQMKGEPLIASMTKIAKHLGLNDRTISTSVRKMIEHGIVEATKKSVAVGYEYTGVDVAQKWGTGVSLAVEQRIRPNPIKTKANVGKTLIDHLLPELNETGDMVDELPDWM